MRRHVRIFVEIVIIMIALGAGMFSQRVAIADWVAQRLKPELPQEMTYDSVVQKEEDVSTGIKSVSDSGGIKPSPDREPDREVVTIDEMPDVESDNDPVTSLPPSINLAVPFTPQAPHADWSLPYKEACEEASVYMVDAYYKGVASGLVDADTAKEQIDSIIAFETALFGFYEDTTVEQTATFAESMFGYGRVDVIENPTVEIIKQHLAEGRPVIVPAAGRQLNNPYFQQPGPIYHMLVIRGYTDDGQFITNDPGTRRGEALLYDFDTIMTAMHDWNGGDVENGGKVVIVVYP
jgi:hypothetical protein